MAMQVTQLNDVKVYNLTAGKSLPQFLEEARKKHHSLRKDEDFRKRVDIIQDFEFNIASTRVAVSPDGEYLAATGVYPPEVRLFEARELGMKCSRGLNTEVVDFRFLSDDYRKLVFLLDDRTVEFHAQYGFHHRLRVPKAGRSLDYDAESCSLLVGGSSSEVVRLDLEVGSFQSPIALQSMEEVHQVAVNPALPVVSCCGDKGLVESYDLRDTAKPLRSLRVADPEDALLPAAAGTSGDHVTCCAYAPNGMFFAAGTAAGVVRVYDIRSSKPLCERDHMNGFAIRSVSFHTRGPDSKDLLVGSADQKSVKIWEAGSAKIAASVESPHTINQLVFFPKSGMFFTANDTQRIGVYFVPSLGLAPPWCSFLDSMTEELEEGSKKVVFDDYQFLTTDELEQLGATELIGTKYLQPYMHGYFMDHRLHARLKTAMDPFRFEEYRKERIRQRIEAKRTMRTRVKVGNKVQVNQSFHNRLQADAEEGGTEGASKKRKAAADRAKALLNEDRFKAMFEDADFAIEDKGVGAEAAALAEALPATRKKGRKGGRA
uniref:Uncharacterized protein n=1 Tax=Zooxanthella nutricula TaxID=1333877 RepID=A0A6U6ICA2_9DINO|mmetsp:Transcript_18200/g.54408  ORF Transcript_18200/g.54408 Transcript_18200/m.54408 type:complete len:545 (+) Transcript_18200:113-1747(+)